MSGKLCTKKSGNDKRHLGTAVQPTGPGPPSATDDTDDLDALLDEIHLPDALPGQHFHIDFGFVCGSELSDTNDKGNLVSTSLDGIRAYCLIADGKTRYLWIYLSDTKEAPIELVHLVLEKFKSASEHRTGSTDQDKALGLSKELNTMVTKAGFTMEVTGTDYSKQNYPAEQPHYL